MASMSLEGEEKVRTGAKLDDVEAKRAARLVLCVVLIVSLLILCWIQLDMSTQWGADCFAFFQTMPVEFMVLSVFTLGALFCSIYAICGSLTASGAIISIMSTLIAVTNYYVIEFHGGPLSFLELKNAATAANVMGSYTLEFTPVVTGILTLGVIELAISFIGLRAMQKHAVFGKRSWKRRLGLLAAAALIVFFGYASPYAVKPAHVLIWNWTTAYPYYGYIPCTVDTLQTCFNLVEKPEGYSDGRLAEIDMPTQVSQTSTPDIVLILNETFYDLHQASYFATDVDYMQGINSLDGAITGYAVVPSIGGGTNKSEYELLTGNSMAPLAQSGSPFFTVDMTDAPSLVTILKAQGYETTACHPSNAVNYSRNAAYPAMGFDHVYFFDSFEDLESPRDRWYESDESTYANVIRWYEENRVTAAEEGVDRPQFMYCLTIQNHGNWSSGDDSYDTVHAIGNFGGYNDDVNEYLTGIAESDAAFVKLVDYFAHSDRPTIVCMAGDHSPSFAANIADTETHSDDELDLLLRATPYVIWANFDLTDSGVNVPEYMSINHLTSTVARLAGVGLSPYYAFQLELMKTFPIVTAYGAYYDDEGNRYNYDDGCNAQVMDYRHLDYANIMREGDPALFAYVP